MQRLVAIENRLRDSIRHPEEASSTQICLEQLRIDRQRVVEVGDALEVAEADSRDAAMVIGVGETRGNSQGAVEALQCLGEFLALD